MPDHSAALLLEIETAIQYIESFIIGFDEPSFLADSRTSAAVAMYLIVIGEAAGGLPVEVRGEATEIPWPSIVSLRNRIAHGYKSIDRVAIWDIAQNHWPTLKWAVRRMLATRGE